MADTELRGGTLGVRGGATAVFVWPPPASEHLGAATLREVLETAPPATPVIVPVRGTDASLPEGAERARAILLACPNDSGFASAMNAAVRQSGQADLIVIADACRLPDGWLGRLRNASYIDDNVAASTALAVGAGEPMFPGFDPDPIPRGSQASSHAGADTTTAPSNPRVFTLWPHCSFIRRSALELVGPFDESLAHPASVLADFAARALSGGLSCALADDVCVERLAGGVLCPETERRALARRHPWRDAASQEETALEPGPLRKSLFSARAARRLLSVTIDARALGPSVGGTQTYVASLLLAVARSNRWRIRAVIADDAPAQAVERLTRAGVELVSYEEAAAGLPRTDIAHRPQQAFSPADLRLLELLGERVVISHLDLIAYRNPAYHASAEGWRAYRRTTRLALAAADQVVFFSEHARRDTVAEDLIDAGRTAVAGIGVEPPPRDGESRRPEGVPPDRELLLMLGADYLHKNRLFALELADQLRQRHGWKGVLVLAGTHVAHGSSQRAEAEMLQARPQLAAQVIDLGPVVEVEKRWLMEHAAALLYPSTYEGFGLGPLEAAAAGLPCAYAPCTSLGEIAGRDAATIVPWDARASADSVARLLFPGAERERHLALLSGALARCSWEQVVERLYQVYVDALASPYRGSAPRAWEELKREEHIGRLNDAYRGLNDAYRGLNDAYRDLGERVAFGLPLIDRGGLLTRAQQRGLMRVGSRRWLSGPLLGPFGVLGSIERESG